MTEEIDKTNTVEDYANAIAEAYQSKDFKLVVELWTAAERDPRNENRNDLYKRVGRMLGKEHWIIGWPATVEDYTNAITEAYQSKDYDFVVELWCSAASSLKAHRREDIEFAISLLSRVSYEVFDSAKRRQSTLVARTIK